jgi:hypothetical protein
MPAAHPRSPSSDRRLPALAVCVAVLAGTAFVAWVPPASAAEPGPRPSAWTAPLPVPLAVDRRFEPPTQRWLSGHRGVDLLASAGSPVLAAGDGTVVFAGMLAGRGVLSIQHTPGGSATVRTTYEPIRAVVEVGDPVRRGEVVGWLEAGGHCLLPCLHWGLRLGDDYGDPLALLRPPLTRLLPHLRPQGAEATEPSPRAVLARPRTTRGSTTSRVGAAQARPPAEADDDGPGVGGGTAVAGAVLVGSALLAGRSRRRTTPARSEPSPPTGGRVRRSGHP